MVAKLILQGTQKVISKLRGMTLGGTGTLSVRVSYNAPYSVFVHEDLTKYHAPPTQAKFVEQPARQLRQEMRDMVAKKLKQKRALDLALLAAGQLLYDASQLLVPVDTGLLKASGRIEVV
jgi:hypothetical protein